MPRRCVEAAALWACCPCLAHLEGASHAASLTDVGSVFRAPVTAIAALDPHSPAWQVDSDTLLAVSVVERCGAYGVEARAAIQADLVPWALGEGDPCRSVARVSRPEVTDWAEWVSRHGLEFVEFDGRLTIAEGVRSSMIPKIKYIAAYRVAPESAITHIAPVASIQQWPETSKYAVNFGEPAKKIEPIRLLEDGRVKAPQAPRYTSLARLKQAKSLDEAF